MHDLSRSALRDVTVMQKILTFKAITVGCNIAVGNGLVRRGNKPLPGPPESMFTDMDVLYIWTDKPTS